MRLEGREFKIILLLACIQFTHTVDFVMMMPLAPIFMKTFQIGPETFSIMVSSYTWSSAVFGIIGALFVDRYDRKRVLLTSYAGFIVGTFLCGLSPTAFVLILARTAAGAFAGVMISSVFSIVADIVPEIRRGTALGMVMAAFPVASVLGVPFAVYLAGKFDWHTPFFFLAALSSIVLLVMSFLIPQVREHLKNPYLESSWSRVTHFFRSAKYYPSMIFVFVLMLAAFTIIPFISAYLNSNVGVDTKDFYLVYLFGGLFTFFTSQMFGRMTDRFGKLNLFRWISFFSIFPILMITNLPPVPLVAAILTTTFFMILVSGRFVPGMALITGSVEPERRGAYLSVSTAIQHFGSGLSAYLSGKLLTQGIDGRIENFALIGWISAFFTIVCILLAPRMLNART